ncbi:MAG: cytochrome P450 [SAR86 cluster bacterium]|uniref:Cytochrome P450 n=1 Tax=SAR86 cluster bacterium TaxID=2030880 RepID=A0A520MTK4_9GAMM|nr:MAG: cytochrome P450 [SAR86 cluster bacterium]|tara:strand:- start:911 stop:2269 length:1359 start_codon:yes stop_codon:yes gene_type:complete
MSKGFVLSDQIINNEIRNPAFKQINSFKPSDNLNNLDLFTKGQPFNLYKELRDNSPIFFHEPMPMDPEPGYWAFTRYEDIKHVSMNPKIFSSQYATGNMLTQGAEENRHPKLFKSTIDHMLNLDGQMHLNLRKEHMPFFKPGYVDDLRKKVSVKVTELLDIIAPMGQCNLVQQVSQQLPIYTLSEVLGIPEQDRQKLVSWMEFLELAQYFTYEIIKEQNEGKTESTPDPAIIDMFNSMVDEMFDYGRFILKDKRENPSDDLLTAIANAEIDGEKLSDEFLDGSWLLIIFAGNDTTRNTMSGGIKLLHENQTQKDLLMQNQDLIPNFINETVRCVSPVIHMRRTTLEETEINGQRIGAHEKVALWYGAANRDPAIFENPDEFNILRKNADKHLAFGIGRHTCLGKPVALMQLQEFYSQFLSRFQDFEMNGEWKVAPNNFVHAIQEMPIKFSPK